jgi:HSP20 family molecular chaperone IbpA
MSIAVPEKNGISRAGAYQRRTASPPVDVFESADELLIVADVPGVANDGIDLRVENGTLTLIARHGEPKEESPALVREYDQVDFRATFRIPAGVDTSAIAAETKNGTLVVHLPKAAAAKARKIVVRSND